MRRVLRRLCLALLLIGCGSPESTAPPSEPTASPAVEPAAAPEEFEFRVHDFNWEIQGSTVYALRSDGQLLYQHPVARLEGESFRTEWQEARAVLSSQEVAELRGMLAGFRALDARYVDPDIEDGTITTFWLREESALQEVYCQNRCAPAAVAALEWLRARAVQIPQPHTTRPDLRPAQRWEPD